MYVHINIFKHFIFLEKSYYILLKHIFTKTHFKNYPFKFLQNYKNISWIITLPPYVLTYKILYTSLICTTIQNTIQVHTYISLKHSFRISRTNVIFQRKLKNAPTWFSLATLTDACSAIAFHLEAAALNGRVLVIPGFQY